MSRTVVASLLISLMCAAVGCGSLGKSNPGSLPGGIKSTGREKDGAMQLALGIGSMRDQPLADPVPPPPPNMTLPEIPPPPKDDSLVLAMANSPNGKNSIIPASALVLNTDEGRSPIDRAHAVAAETADSNFQALKQLHHQAVERFKQMEGFECRLTRRETVGSRAMPEEVLQYRYRREPLSLHIKWVGKEAQGREVVYVHGRYDNKVQILTGREPEFFRPSGIKVSRSPSDKDVTSKNRFDIRSGGMAMSIEWFSRVLAQMEKDPAEAQRMRYIGPKPRRERETGLVAVEEKIPPSWEPQLAKGGRRTTHFDADPDSPSFGLPILIVTLDDSGREVEYYWFDHLKPVRFTDADFDVDRLWR
jgi:hypothetical protein